MNSTIYTMGIDVGKLWFHLIGTNEIGKCVYLKKVKREGLFEALVTTAPNLVRMEACPGSQYIARKLQQSGINVRLMAAQFVKPYLKSQKNDFNDAAAIAEAVRRPTMRFVPIKSARATRSPGIAPISRAIGSGPHRSHQSD